MTRVLCALAVIVCCASCTFGRCTSHPYDPKACLAPPGASLGTTDAGPQ